MKSLHYCKFPPLSLLLLGLLPILPWLAPWHLQPVITFHMEWLAVAGGLLACAAVLPGLWRSAQLQLPRTLWLPLTLAAYLGLQTKLLPQVVAPHAYMGMVYLVWAALMMVLIACLRQQFGAERVGGWLAGGLVTAAVLVAWRELFGRLSGSIGDWGGVGQANNYGDLLALGSVSLLYWHALSRLPRIVFALLGFSLMLGLSLTPSRSVLLYWLAIFVIAWRYRSAWLKPIGFGLLGYLALQGLWSLGVLPDAQLSSAERMLQQTSGVSPRWHIWQVAWGLFLQQPLLGHGFGQFDTAYFQAGQYIPALPTYIEHAHNLILHLLAELGLLPVMLLLLALSRWIRPVLSVGDDPKKQAFKTWLLLLAAILGIHSTLEYPLWYAPFLGVAAMVLGLGDELSRPIAWNKTGTVISGSCIAAALSVAVVHEIHYLRMELALLAAVAQPSQQRSDHLVAVCQKAATQAPLLEPYVPMIFTFTGQADDLAMRPQLTVLADVAVRFVPANNLVYRLALMQALSGDQHAAKTTLSRALAAYPNDASKFIVDIFHLKGSDSGKVNFMLPMLASKLGAKVVTTSSGAPAKQF
ncbi:PglL family O-oligosaccharyltransferase [Methylomonas rosea]|uniref:Wzy polymerase domain-containing protein n=1 Tax=Methylomonas rosea TaxID=2952227 RepID=A0ABT1TRT1_9GAMM|nr:O-antigen ligase family protein [Methylomonas sp. WSC-7]MCQ8117091.1 Wzy polymerase domain-containing protein [Methylomonas sp. WSC-7]